MHTVEAVKPSSPGAVIDHIRQADAASASAGRLEQNRNVGSLHEAVSGGGTPEPGRNLFDIPAGSGKLPLSWLNRDLQQAQLIETSFYYPLKDTNAALAAGTSTMMS